jgi:hypothetical protein
MRRIVLGLAILLGAFGATTAGAQEPTGPVLQMPAWPLAPNPQLATPSLLLGEPSAGGDLSPWLASIPLRLSLQSGIAPIGGSFPNCESREDAAGNSFHGVPLQRYALLQLAPRLVLHGFSSAGCPVDGAIGGGVTYSVPLRPSLWLVAGAGVYGVPPHAPFPARLQSETRVDLLKELDGGRSLSVGIGRRGVSFGGTW